LLLGTQRLALHPRGQSHPPARPQLEPSPILPPADAWGLAKGSAVRVLPLLEVQGERSPGRRLHLALDPPATNFLRSPEGNTLGLPVVARPSASRPWRRQAVELFQYDCTYGAICNMVIDRNKGGGQGVSGTVSSSIRTLTARW